MKKTAILIVALAAVAILGSCDLLGGEETWSFTYGSGSTAYCVEVTTNNLDLKRALDQTGVYVKAACDLGTGSGVCTIDSMAGYTEYDVEWTYVYGSFYDAAAVEAACDILGGTYSQE